MQSSINPCIWARLLPLGIGLAFCGCGLVGLWDYPVAHVWLILAGIALAACQWVMSRAWLLAVPITMVCIDLGAWSGRILINEQDGLLAMLAGSAMMAGQYNGAGRQLRRRSFVPLWLFVVVLTFGLARGLFPVPEWDANAESGYLTGWNALRVAKGSLWALLFWPLLAVQMSADRESTQLRLAQGLVLALLGFGVFTLWERGFFSDLATASNLWGLVATWLDLSGTYRITGPFSQMHLGGEAVDGFLVLAWPFALWMLLRARSWPTTVAALMALGLAVYAVMVTFTRTTYLAFGLSLFAFLAVGVASSSRLSFRQLVAVGSYLFIASVLFLAGFRFGGILTTLGYLAVVLGGTVAGRLDRSMHGWPTVVGGLAMLLVAGAALAIRGMTTSQWNAIPLGTASLVTVPSVSLLGAGGMALGRLLKTQLSWREISVVFGCIGLFLPAVTLSLSGYQMQARAGTVLPDLETRTGHWARGLALLGPDLGTRLLGAGLGTFPLTSLLTAQKPSEGIWLYTNRSDGPYLRLVGTGSLCVGQRLSSLTAGKYRFLGKVRNPSDKDATLAVKLQPRRMLESEGWQPLTRELTFRLKPRDPRWIEVDGLLDLTEVPSLPWHSPRIPVFVLANYGANQSVIDIAEVRLEDPARTPVLENGDFAKGGDRWFAYNDFAHLAWHLKSLYVAILFDLGLIGIAIFVILVLTGLWRALVRGRHGHLFGTALFAAMIGFLTSGITGTLFDVPPIMTLFLLVVTAALSRDPARRDAIQR